MRLLLTLLALATSAFCQTETIQTGAGSIIRLTPPPALKKLPVVVKNTGHIMVTWSGTIYGVIPTLTVQELPTENCNANALLRNLVEAFRSVPGATIAYAAGNTASKASATVISRVIHLSRAERFICISADLVVRATADNLGTAGHAPSPDEEQQAFDKIYSSWSSVTASRPRVVRKQ
jgi:hypothetical protein